MQVLRFDILSFTVKELCHNTLPTALILLSVPEALKQISKNNTSQK